MELLQSKDLPGKGSFSHGIHPPDNKSLSRDAAIEVVPTPKRVVLPLLQNIGVPSKSIVQPKKQVVAGEAIGVGEAFISTNLHSPINGVVENTGVCTAAQRAALTGHIY